MRRRVFCAPKRRTKPRGAQSTLHPARLVLPRVARDKFVTLDGMVAATSTERMRRVLRRARPRASRAATPTMSHRRVHADERRRSLLRDHRRDGLSRPHPRGRARDARHLQWLDPHGERAGSRHRRIPRRADPRGGELAHDDGVDRLPDGRRSLGRRIWPAAGRRRRKLETFRRKLSPHALPFELPNWALNPFPGERLQLALLLVAHGAPDGRSSRSVLLPLDAVLTGIAATARASSRSTSA